jgi:hypothetical protein
MAAGGMRRPRAAQANIERLALTEQLWQLRNVARDAPSLIHGETMFRALSVAVNPSGADATVQSPLVMPAYRVAEVE